MTVQANTKWAPPRTLHVHTVPLDHYHGTAFSTVLRTVWADGSFAGTVVCKRSRLSGDVVWQAYAADGRPLVIIRSGFHRAGYDAAWTVIHDLEATDAS